MRFTSRMHFQQTFRRPLYGHTIDQIRKKKSENNGKSLLYHHGEYDGLRMLLGAERKRCWFFLFLFCFSGRCAFKRWSFFGRGSAYKFDEIWVFRPSWRHDAPMKVKFGMEQYTINLFSRTKFVPDWWTVSTETRKIQTFVTFLPRRVNSTCR